MDESKLGCPLDLPDGPLSIILKHLHHDDVLSLDMTCWTAAQRVIQLAANRVTVDINRTSSTQTCLKLLSAYRHYSATLNVEGSSDYVNKQLAAMQAVAPRVEVVNITLTVHYTEIRDMHRLANQLYRSLEPLTSYTHTTALGLAIISACSSTATDTKTTTLFTNMPAIKELVVLEHNAIETVPLINTLCQSVVPCWQLSIETIRLYHNFVKDKTTFHTLSILNRVRIFVHELHTPCLHTAFAVSLALLLKAGSIQLAPDPSTQTLCLYPPICCQGFVLPTMSWKDIIEAITAQQPFHLHVHTSVDCSELWQALSERENRLHVDHRRTVIHHPSITYSGDEDGYGSLQYLREFTKPITIHVKNLFYPFLRHYACSFPTSPCATVKVYCHRNYNQPLVSRLCDWLQGRRRNSSMLLERYVQHGSKWVLEA